ncbi:MAG: carbamoyltransferase C-terminal domain-containing protein [Patescibacteria group bacterium]
MKLVTDKPIYILGINHAYHELSACIIKDGQVLAAAEEERFTRIKRGKEARVDNPDLIPVNSINFCIKYAGIEFSDVNFIALSFFPKDRLRNIDVVEEKESGDWGTKEGEEMFFNKLNNFPNKLSEYYGVDISKKIHWIPHHLAHAASSYLVSPFVDAAVLAIDGIGEFDSAFLGHGKDNKIEKVGEVEYPNSLGFIWEKIAKFLGFSEYDAGKVMGFTAYGDPQKYIDKFKTVVKIGEGDFTVDNNIFKFRSDDFGPLEKLFGLKKIEKWSDEYLKTDYVHIAASLQKITEEIVIGLVEFLKKRTNSTNLCLSGGVALNCLMNSAVLETGLFDDVYIQPASNDAGTALGAAIYVWANILGNKRVFIMNDAYLGPTFNEQEILTAINSNKLIYKKSDDIAQETAHLLAEGKIVGWFQGAMEFGPRALGNRSLLADPRTIEMKEKMNKIIKKRESFRPFAPSVLYTKAKDWFDISSTIIPISTDFMLFSFKVKEDKIPLVPAIQQIDHTARIQTVREETNERYYNLISCFEDMTGVPMLLNTSFNDNEPIVCTPEDAIRTFLNNNFDVLVLGDFIVKR